MSGSIWIFVLLGAAVAGLIFIGLRYAQPEFPPLETKPDDPLLLDATRQARETLAEFDARLADNPKDAIVKLRYVSDAGAVEHLWAEVLERKTDATYQVRLASRPVTQKVPVEPVMTCRAEDIEDWQVRDADGGIHGAFSQRAMFKIARRDGVKLPKKLEALEKFYR